MKNLVIYCPSDERGGVKKILNNLLKILVANWPSFAPISMTKSIL